MITQHSSESNEHYTPRAVVEAARALMGEIDFDPFSCAEANKVVRARAFCALPQNGFLCEWSFEGKPARVFCNPPGGKLNKKTLEPLPRVNGKQYGPGFSSAAVAWSALMHGYQAGLVAQAVFVGFNLEVLRHSQRIAEMFPAFADCPSALEFPLCFPKERLEFWNADKTEEDSDPTCANVLVYVPPLEDHMAGVSGPALQRFARAFSPIGAVKL